MDESHVVTGVVEYGQARMASEMEVLFDRLWPLMRSITGPGVRQTHEILAELVSLSTFEVPSGTQVLDWTVPPEWSVREAYIITPDGNRILDIKGNNLHLVNYSCPIRATMRKADLVPHLYSLPEKPDAIPYVTSYYNEDWGFCIRHNELSELVDGDYKVVIDSKLDDAGSMTISEAVLEGSTDREILFSTYTCHPSMANNELSGPIVCAFLYKLLSAMKDRQFTYRFVFLPESIGAIAFLARRGQHLKEHLDAGLVVSCIGDPANLTYKGTRRGNSMTDNIARYVLRQRPGSREMTFSPFGSDEKHYCSPGFNLPIGVVARSIYQSYDEYHTSEDNKEFISFQSMTDSVQACLEFCRAAEINRTYRNLVPYGEPQLGKRGLYPVIGARRKTQEVNALKWFLNLADGETDLLAMADRSGMNLEDLHEAAVRGMDAGIVAQVLS